MIIRTIAGAITETDEAIAADNFDPRSIIIDRHSRLFFTSLHPRPDSELEYSKTQAEVDFRLARDFFNAQIPTTSNPLHSYDDIDNAFIVGLFRGSDKQCFYVLTELRKTISANVIALTVIFSLIVSIVAIANFLWSAAIDFSTAFGISIRFGNGFELLGSRFETDTIFNKFMFGTLSCALGVGLMYVLYHAGYEQAQRFNGQHLNNFLVRYLSDINIRFRQSLTNATRTAFEEADTYNLKSDALLWIINLHWMAFRTFFIQKFLRTVLFQVRRHTIWVVFSVPAFCFFLIFIGAYVFDIPQLNMFRSDSALYQQNSFYFFFGLLLLAYYRFLTTSLLPIADYVDGAWHKFNELNVVNAMSNTVEVYTNQLDLWRGRFREGAAGSEQWRSRFGERAQEPAQVGAPGIGG